MIHPEKVELRPDRMAVVIHPEKVELRPGIMAAVIHQEKVERRKGDRPRVHGVGTHSEQLHPDSPKGEEPGTRDHHTRTIAYPIRICCPDH